MDNSETLATQGTQDEEKQSKNTTQHVQETTMRKQIQQIRYEPSYKQLEDQRTTSCYAEIVTDIKPRNSERKDT